MKTILLICTLATILFVTACTTETHPLDDSKSLQGKWVCVSATVDGVPLSDRTIQLLRLTITRNRYRTEKDAEVLFDSTYTIDSAKDPKQINLVGTEGDLIGKEAQGIYSVEKDTLRICYTMPGSSRPTGFQSGIGSKAYSILWKRE